MRFYTYLILGEDGRFYYGHRSCECDPKEDTYMGSCYDKTFKPVRKRILKEFSCLDLAIIEEMRIHVTKNVGPSPRYANGVTLRPNGMSRRGVRASEETKQRMRIAKLGRKMPSDIKKKLSEKQSGVPKTAEHKENMSKARKGRKRYLLPSGECVLAREDEVPAGSTVVSAWVTPEDKVVWVSKEEARARGWRYASTVKIH